MRNIDLILNEVLNGLVNLGSDPVVPTTPAITDPPVVPGADPGVPHEDDGHEEHEIESAVGTGFIIVLIMLMFYMSAGAVIEKYHCTFGHEASFTVIVGKLSNTHLFITQYLDIGILISFIELWQGNGRLISYLQFSDITFFYFCLPPIVFASGFNM